jgi:exodeoxyribonuclease V gamma subunit
MTSCWRSFAAADPPTPDQILVLLPDLPAAAPLIDAVFGTAPAERRIPYTITGLPQTRINPIARVLDCLLALCGSRFTASAVFDLLQQPPVAARFALGNDDLALIRDWIRDAGIRWGLDAEPQQPRPAGQPTATALPTACTDLFLAYALGDEPLARNTVIAGRIAAANPEGGDAATLGRWWRFLQALRELRDDWSQARDASAWQRSLSAALDRFTRADDELVDDLRALQATINELHANMLRGGVRSPLPLAVVHSALTACSTTPGAAASRRRRHLLVAEQPARPALPRGLPARHDDGAFPSANRPGRVRPDGAAAAAGRPAAPPRRAQPVPRPAPRCPAAPLPELQRPQHP